MPGLEVAETFWSFGNTLFPEPEVGGPPELPDEDELGRSLGSLALRLLVKACGTVEVSELESKLADPSSRPHLLLRTGSYFSFYDKITET